MNGRVYDPTLGRFLSADPNVQAPDDTQSFNRYSYVKNNPLSYTDPSGFFFKKIFKKIKDAFSKAFKAVGNLIKKALQNQYITSAIQIGINFIPGLQGWATVLISAAFSGLVTLANGGDLGQALMSAGIAVATAAAFHGVGTAFAKVDTSFFTAGHIAKTIAHGAVGGVSSKLRGGKFHTGFLSAAAAQFAAPGIDLIGEGDTSPGAVAARTAAAAVVGGAVAELGGGKFANGAVTGAMSRFFNDEHGLKKLGLLSGKAREDIGFLGNQIRERLDTEFGKQLFERYWKGEGDLTLSEEQFQRMIAALSPSAPILESAHFNTENGAFHAYKRDFYGTQYDESLGSAWVVYDKNYSAVGLIDRYNFHMKPFADRPIMGHIKTMMVVAAKALNSSEKAFSVRYGVTLDALR
uniref:RHS repeat-associated core domain-containing protein n=1 Tax=Pelagibius sp. Alg239-R121 TaxID=2993448 RepID=UPI0024A75B2B